MRRLHWTRVQNAAAVVVRLSRCRDMRATAMPSSASRPPTAEPGGSELVLGEPGAELAAAGGEPLGTGVGLPVHRMVAPTLAARRHRERVLPRGHVGLQLSAGLGELGL